MTEWAYKANEKRRSIEDTGRLADEYGFLARSAHRQDERAVAYVGKVKAGDVVHFYYRSKRRGIVELGSYRVLPAETPRFPAALGDAGLVQVAEIAANDALLGFLRAAPTHDGETGYKRDPRLGVFTGFRIERIADLSPPKFDVWRFPQKGTLTRKRMAAPLREADAPLPDALLSRVTHDAAVMAGRACIRGMRVTVGTILGLLAAGHGEQEILAEYPYLEAEDLRAALAYAAYRMEEREIPLSAA
jgi:uncharacterized protein (DUF433 family)